METKVLTDNLPDFILDLQDKEISKKSYEKYKKDINKFINYLSSIKIFSKNDYLNYIDLLIQNKYKISSINSYIVSINKYLNFLNQPQLKIKTKKTQRKQSVENVPELKDYKRLLRISKRYNLLESYYLIKLIAGTGIRVSEVKFFTPQSLIQSKTNDNVVLVCNKGKWREVTISTSLINELLKYAKSKGIIEGFIFPKKRNQTEPLSPNIIWKKIQKIAGLSKINKKYAHPHALRHLFAKTYLALHPGEYMALADLLGHNDVRTTSIYTQESRKEKKNKVNELGL